MASIVNTSRIAVIGMGQLGASLAKAFRDAGARDVFGIARRVESLEQAVAAGYIDSGSTDPADVLPVVDIAFLCLPLQASIDFCREHLRHFRTGSIVTDVGSVKGRIVAELRPLLMQHGTYFIGAHPMAGSEKSGIDACNPGLYKDAIVFLTPTPEDDHQVIDLVADFWRGIGANPLELPADRHDAAVAHSSHMPHVVAAALADAVLRDANSADNAFAAAGGFRDMSRIAASSVSMWTEICRFNTDATLQAMAHFQARLDAFRAALEAEDWAAVERLFASGRESRTAWISSRESKPAPGE